ncbi:O-antigen ligase family protein [Bordetella genomosp. 12]|uniref:O-antigen ligase-related domain-containing protein n=1 Tax=Bordetella genomosp. 12 TaxID=463035 RepID=A0A261VN12_9BORD|nr:O-antigen ligase family protein [Bordetella genomosp. 12]OZI75141.1 hypothetical protein CAL22_12105 [Bordetella genomosp. 12]
MAVTALALLVPALALISADGGPAILYVTSFFGLTAWAVNAVTRREPFDFRSLAPMAVALFSPLTAMLITNAVHDVWSSSEFEKLLRFALAVPIGWMLLRARREWLRNVQWSLIFSAYAGSIMLLAIVWSPGLGRMAVSEFGGKYNAVAFADLTLFFGFASALCLPWVCSPWPRLEAALKLLAVPLSVYAVWVSETRSSWILFAVLGLVILLDNRHWSRRMKLAFVGGAAAFMLAGLVFSWNSSSSRMSELWSEFQRYEQQDRDTSTGIRMQLWQASWLMFKEHPLVGVGAPNFREELGRFEQQGIVTARVATDYGEPHNDFLAALAGYGLIGLLSFCALYFIPAAVFWRRLRSADTLVRVGARIGLLFTLGYSLFSVTEMMFRNMRSVPIYAITLVVLYALTREKTPDPIRVR